MTRNLIRVMILSLVSMGCVFHGSYTYAAEHDTEKKLDRIIADCTYQDFLRASDGMNLVLHYQDQDLDAFGLLGEAKQMYEKLVVEFGFNRPSYPDPDRTIDIFVTNKKYLSRWIRQGVLSMSSERSHAPCFNAIEEADGYQMAIFLPENIKKTLADDPVSLRGTLIHELAHAVLFQYNKNVQGWLEHDYQAGAVAQSFGKDWYAEGLARFFEIRVGSNAYFYQAEQTSVLGGIKTTKRDGVNYLMDHPGRPFWQAGYDYALFWEYLYEQYGMEKIEELSWQFSRIRPRDVVANAPEILSDVFEKDFSLLIHDFAKACASKNFDPVVADGLNDLAWDIMTPKSLVSSLMPWEQSFIRVKDKRLLKSKSFNIHAAEGLIMSVEILYGDGTMESHRVQLDRDQSAWRFQLKGDLIDRVREIRFVMTNLDEGNTVRVSTHPRIDE